MENKHYIRLDGTTIVKGFSDAFETPLETDICIGEGGRHFELFGVINPTLADGGVYLYKYEGEKVIALTAEEIEIDRPVIKKTVSEIDQLWQLVGNLYGLDVRGE